MKRPGISGRFYFGLAAQSCHLSVTISLYPASIGNGCLQDNLVSKHEFLHSKKETIMKYSDTNRKAQKIAVYIALPVCVFSTLLFRSPINEVLSADMPGGISRYSNKSREISTPLEYVHERRSIQRAAFEVRGKGKAMKAISGKSLHGVR